MTGKIDKRLMELGITLPETSPPAANYLPYKLAGSLVFMAGQICQWNGERRYVGQLGDAITAEDGVAAAWLCGLNLIAWLKVACAGNLDRVDGCIRLGGFVNSAPGFHEQPKIINGCSDLMVEIFGDAGRHARTAVGTNALPFNVSVEVDAVFSLKHEL